MQKFSFLAATLLAFCTSQTGMAQTAETDDSNTSTFDWFAGQTPAGETTIVRAGDGRVSTELFVHWNNREYRLESELQLDAEGMVTSQRISGVSPFGATIDESFSYANGEASWRTVGESGKSSGGASAFYVPTEWGSVGSLEALVRAASKRMGGEIPLYPAGTARVEKITETLVNGAGESTRLSLYAISGIGFTPNYAWFDDQMNLAARAGGRLGMLPRGWNPGLLETLGKLQSEQNALRSAELSRQLAHPLDGALLISHVDVVDVASGSLLADHHVLVDNGQIVSVSPGLPEQAAAWVIDGRGKTLIPGLWDMHGHFSLEDGILNIAGGITSVRDLGSVHERMLELREKFDSGEVIGPTTYAAASIDKAGPYANRNPAESVAEVKRLIDKFAAAGYIQIKLYSSIEPGWVPAIADYTHEKGLRLSGHVPAFMSAEQAILAGFDEIQHINMVFLNFLVGDKGDTRQQIRFTTYGNEGGKLDLSSQPVQDFVQLLLDRNIVIDPTAAIFESMMIHLPGAPDPTFAKIVDHLPLDERRHLYNPEFEIGEARIHDWAETARRQAEMIRLLFDSGVQLVAGSDSMPGFTIHRELEVYAEAGIPNADVLRIATLDSARVTGVAERTGSVEAGKASDLVLLEGNPLQDISAVRNAVLVMKGNTLFQPDRLYPAMGVKPFRPSLPLPVAE